MSTTETIVVIVAIGAVVYLVTRQQQADKPAAEAPAPSGYGRNRQDFFAELSEDISGAVVALGGQAADVEKKKLEIEAAKKTG